MNISHEHCYRALRTHDARFDGHFFVAVSSTGIYCRPVCAVRTPRPENCHFYISAAAAESAGYRPCMRCRPELAPGNASVDATRRLARVAAELIDEGALNDQSLPALAEQLGVSDRHLRRSFKEQYGVAPHQYAQTRRLLLAKQLLTDTRLTVTEVAMNSGFSSLRRFNALFKECYRMTPSALRKMRKNSTPGQSEQLQLSLSYRQPFDWQRLIGFLSKRTIAGVESVTDNSYHRTLRLQQGDRTLSGWLSVSESETPGRLLLQLPSALAPALPVILTRIRRLFDLDCNPEPIAQQLGSLAEARPGLRLPGAFDGFEMAIRAIVGQQVTVKAAHTLAGRLAERFGLPLDTPAKALNRTFPDAARLSEASIDDIASLGIVSSRARAIIALARAVADGELNLNHCSDIDHSIEQLQALPGIGPWTAQYIAMRALSWPDAFPASDLGLIRAMGLKQPKQLQEQAEAWRPWRAYAVIHLWTQLSEGQS